MDNPCEAERPNKRKRGETTSTKKKKKNIGTHSIRKGAATYTSSGCTGGPSIVSIILRAGWSLGGTMERYFRYEYAGDHYLGRVVAGLPNNSSDFSILPPHFGNQPDIELSNHVKVMFPTLYEVPHLQGVLKLVLASLVYHYEFITENMRGHAILSTPLFCNPGMRLYLQSILISGFESAVLRPSGIPPHVELFRKLDKNYKSIISLPQIILQGVGKILEDKGDYY